MKILVLSGKQGVGKSTLASTISEKYVLSNDEPAIVLKFAGPLYEMHDAVLKVLENYLPERVVVKDGPLLQVLGNEWGRKTIDKNIWVNIMRRSVDLLLNQKGLIVIDDCRFENEFDALPEALRVRLIAHHDIRKERCSAWRENENHPSEIDLDNYSNSNKFDLYFNTDIASIEECTNQIMTALSKNIWVDLRK